jgi:hypothetical protein
MASTQSWWPGLDVPTFYAEAKKQAELMRGSDGASKVNAFQARGFVDYRDRVMRGMPKHGGLGVGYATDDKRI